MSKNKEYISMPVLVWVQRGMSKVPWYRRVVTTIDKDGELVIVTQYSSDMKTWVDVSEVCTREESNRHSSSNEGVHRNMDGIESTY